MARFSGPDVHPQRRAAVVAAIERIDVARAEAIAEERTADTLRTPRLDSIATIARSVPTETLVICLGVTDGLDDIAADVEAMVRVIGRGDSANAGSDAAVDRLSNRFAASELGVIPVLSILYQNFDATAALFATTLLATATGDQQVPAVPRTRRVAAAPTTVGGTAIEPGTPVTLEIGAADMPFGAGPHQCPGRELATHIVRGMVTAVDTFGYRVDADAVDFDPDGRPASLPLLGPSMLQPDKP